MIGFYHRFSKKCGVIKENVLLDDSYMNEVNFAHMT